MEFESRYSEIKELGSGTFGVVKLVKDAQTGTFFACKEVEDVADILVGVRETDVMTRIRGLHPNIVSVEDFNMTVRGDRYRIKQVMEYCSGGSLEELLKEESTNPDRGIKGSIGGVYNRLENLLNIVNALGVLQRRGIFHMDVKTENILYRVPPTGKGKTGKRIPEMCLCDFSNYYLETPWKGDLNPPAGPIEAVIYRPPEVGTLLHRPETYDKIDVWAMGVVIAETMGAWGVIQAADTRVTDSVGSMKALLDKIQLLRNNRKNGKDQGGKREKPSHPVKSLFPAWFFRDKLGGGFSSSSVENEMVHSLLYAREFSSGGFRETALKEAIDYFTVRGVSDLDSIHIITRVFDEVLPACFKLNPGDRITITGLSDLISDILKMPRFDFTVEEEMATNVGGSWEIVLERVWRETVLDFYESTRGLQVQYGRLEKIPLPFQSVLLAKRIAEEYIKTCGPDQTSYRAILGASMFLASELMDFIFPYENCSWFDDEWTLAKICPYIRQIAVSLMGKLGQLSMGAEDRQLLSIGDPESIFNNFKEVS